MSGIDRRSFLVLSGGCAAAAGLGCASATHLRWRAADGALSGASDADRVLRVPLAELERAGPGRPLLVSPGGGAPDVLLVRQGDGVAAVAPDCTHWGSTVDWDVTAGQWRCPNHGSRFAPDGAVVEGPADEPLARYVTRVEGGDVLVELPRKS